MVIYLMRDPSLRLSYKNKSGLAGQRKLFQGTIDCRETRSSERNRLGTLM